MATPSSSNKTVAASVAVVLIAVATVSRVWVEVASHYVPEPYLDEVFHVPQAQKYCDGKFGEWDDKITTPPGLYLLSLLIPKNLTGRSLSEIFTCDTTSLRGVNALALTALAFFALLSRWQIEARLHGAQSPTKLKAPSQYAIHSALNIALFPVIFFFSGLYYTDVASTVVVLAAFVNSLQRMGRDKSSFWSDLLTISLGLMALLMRQTNVFWVVVFLGGLEVVHAVKTLRPQRVDERPTNTVWERIKFFSWRYSVGDIHDPPSHVAWEDDVLFTALSIFIAAICNPLRILRQVWPHIAVLGAFSSFIIWNGGVVLGDKSNHVATIHLAQMLYIWPFFAFFSLPLLLPYATPIMCLLRDLYGLTRVAMVAITGRRHTPPSVGQATTEPRSTKIFKSGSHKRKLDNKTKKKNDGQPETTQIDPPTTQDRSPALKTLIYLCQSKIEVWLIYTLASICLSVVIVRFNTIIHPFTLADNRHYMFYVFRYTIRRSSRIRYALVMVYTVSRWMIWGTLCGCSQWFFMETSKACSMNHSHGRLGSNTFACHPFTYSSGGPQSRGPFSGPLGVESEEIRAEKQEQSDRALRDDPLVYSTEPVSTSTTLIFLIATALSLVTAPLVEPRYFIIPWVIWRLLIPAWRLHTHLSSPLIPTKTGSYLDMLINVFQHYDPRLVLETVWFVAINLGTIYIFLFKPYQWRAVDGGLLDEGRWQRFMW